MYQYEDFKENRALNVKFIEGIDRIHQTTENRVQIAKQRNVEVSKADLKNRPDDPRAYFNLANSYVGAGEFKKARKMFLDFIEKSKSDDENYIAYKNLSSIEQALGNKDKAILYSRIAIGLKPDIPDAYYQIGYMMFEFERYDDAEQYLMWGMKMKPQIHKLIVFNPRDYDYNPIS